MPGWVKNIMFLYCSMVLSKEKEQKDGFHCKATFNKEDEMSSFPREIEIKKEDFHCRKPYKTSYGRHIYLQKVELHLLSSVYFAKQRLVPKGRFPLQEAILVRES